MSERRDPPVLDGDREEVLGDILGWLTQHGLDTGAHGPRVAGLGVRWAPVGTPGRRAIARHRFRVAVGYMLRSAMPARR